MLSLKKDLNIFFRNKSFISSSFFYKVLSLSLICFFIFLNRSIGQEKKLFQERITNASDNKELGQENSTLSGLIDKYLNQKLIFVVGAVSSGTTLMRLILDVHPDVNCGDETKIVHLMLEFVNSVYRNPLYV